MFENSSWRHNFSYVFSYCVGYICWALLFSLIASVQVSVNNGLLKCFGTAKILGIDFSEMSFKMDKEGVK